MKIRVLGELEVEHAGSPLALGGPQRYALLALLVAAEGRPVPVDTIVDQLWGEKPPPKALTALHVLVARLRRELEPERGPRQQPSVLVTRPSGYALDLPAGAVDAVRFEELTGRAAVETNPTTAEELLVEALALWRGPAYGGLGFASMLAAEATRLEELRLSAIEGLWDARLARGRRHEAVGELSRLVADHPLRERLWRSLVLALYQGGRQADALDALRRVRRRLSDDLGIDPGTELQQLEQAVLRQDPGLAPDVGTGASVERPSDDTAAPSTLTGRHDWLHRTEALVRAASAGSGHVLLITGEPGIGKTRFARAVATQAAAAGMRCAWGTWEEEGCPPLWGWLQALGDHDASTRSWDVDDDSASAAFRRADLALTALRRDGGTCLVLDDVQWADASSQRLIARFATVLRTAPVLFVLACRDPLVDASAGTASMLATLARQDSLRVALGGLTSDEVAGLVRERAGISVDPRITHLLHERTEGNPFYVNELVRLLVEEGGLADVRESAWRAVPAGIRDVVRHRLAGLPPSVAQVLSSAAVLGRTFDLDILESMWRGKATTFEEALELATAAALVVEDDVGRCRFAHALVRDTVYADLPISSRGRAHVSAAEAIERRRVGRLDEHAAALAEHYRLGGHTHARSAWTYAARAGRMAARQGSYEDAAQMFASAADLQSDDEMAGAADRERVLVELGVALRQSARAPEAWAPLAAAAEWALDRGDAAGAASALLSVTEQMLWSWRKGVDTDAAGVVLWERVLSALPADATGLRARCQAALAVELIHDPPDTGVAALVDAAVRTARGLHDPAVLSEVLQIVVNPMLRPDLVLRRAPLADELVQMCVRRNDERGLAMALCKRAPGLSVLGRPEEAIRDLHRARGLAQRHHLAPVLMVVDFALALLLGTEGNREESEQALAEAESIQSTISMAGAGIGVSLRATVAFAEGRIAQLEEPLREVAGYHHVLRELSALSRIGPDRRGVLAAELGPWSEQSTLPWDYVWLTCTVARGLVWAAMGDGAAISDLRSQLGPFADRVADGGLAAGCLGSVRHTLGELALAAGDVEDAAKQATLALETHRRFGWPLWEGLSAKLLARIES